MTYTEINWHTAERVYLDLRQLERRLRGLLRKLDVEPWIRQLNQTGTLTLDHQRFVVGQG